MATSRQNPTNTTPATEDKSTSPLAASDLRNEEATQAEREEREAREREERRAALDAERDKEQTWVSAKNADGEVERIKSEEYPAWEKEQDAKRASRS